MERKITDVIVLREPVTMGQRTIDRLEFREPKLRDLITIDQYGDGTVAGNRVFASALTGESENLLDELCPEDWADCRVVIGKALQRFTGLVDTYAGKKENPTMATA